MAKMTDTERVARHRRRKLWALLKSEGWESPKQLQDEARRLGIPWTWNSRKKIDGHVGDPTLLLPSMKVIDTLRKRRRSGGK